MVPIEQLGEKNLLHTYYIASEIKEKLEMEASNTVTIPHALFVSGTIKHYPSSEETRKQTLRYMKEAGYITSVFHSGAKVYVDVPNQETIFSLCTKSLTLYHQRFRQVAPEKLAVDKLTDEQVENLHKILGVVTIRLSMSRPPHIIYIPLQHFPSEIQPSDILGLLYKSDKDFHILRFTKIIGEKVSEQEAEIRIKDEKMEKALGNFRKILEARYLKVVEKRKQELIANKSQVKENPVQEQEKVHKVEVVNSHLNVRVQTNTIASKVGRFPEKLKAGTQWRDITFVFIDERNVVIHVNGKKVPQSCEDMKMVKGKNEVPTETWKFFECLARHNSEITPTDPDAKPTFKKQKELLSSALKAYFQKEEDPFFPYDSSPEKRHRSYKTRFGVFYEEKGKKADKFADLGSVMNEQMQRQ